MAIDARCTFCRKIYRLKDDLAGKKVTCANTDCRKIFQVTPLDADTIAAAALSDEVPVQAPVESRTIAMSCVICEHKWNAAWDMQGKNVLCPECKHRQKVPEQKENKPADWRTGGGGPSMAKREVLEGVTSARDTSMVSGDTLLKTGVIDDGVEPVPLKVKLMRWGGLGLAVCTVLFGIYYFGFKRPGSNRENRDVNTTFEVVSSDEFKPLPLHRAIINTAAAEYYLRSKDEKALPKALDYYSSAMNDLSSAPKGLDRDCLTVELALSMLNLGGDGDDLKDKKRIPWTPQPDARSGPQVSNNRAEQEGVVGQVRRVLELLQKNGADLEFRQWAARRMARELIARGHLEVLDLGALFVDADQPEMNCQIALEQYRAGKPEVAEQMIKSSGDVTAPSGLALQAIFNIKPLAESNAPSNEVRMALTAMHLAKKEYAAAVASAAKPGPHDSRIRALALCAEWSDEIGPVLDEADKVAAEILLKSKTDPNVMLPTLPPGRIAISAAKGGDARAEAYAKRINDRNYTAYVQAEVLRQKMLRANSETFPDDAAELPQNPDDLKAFLPGHAWGRFQLARHNGALANIAAKLREGWPKPLVAPFGSAGALLGAQDKAQ